MSLDPGASDNEDTASVVPSLDSEDPRERIEARKLRIAARIEAKKREALGMDLTSMTDGNEDPRKSYKQTEDSRQRLSKLVSDGTQLVTNIQIVADARETQRRQEEEALRRTRIEKINHEATSGSERFNDITQKWLQTRAKQIPQELWAMLDSQQQQCAQLIEDKNQLIGELQQELKRKDNQYVKDLKTQGEDIGLLVERMEEQVRNLTKTYREELLQIEKSFESERRELLDDNRKKWEQGMETHRDKELETLMNRMRKVEEYEQQLNQLRVQDGEEYNTIKIKLETDVQILQQQLQQMKATYQLNQEKLEYNFQVLKKRDEESTITKSQQKRRITRLQDVLNNLRIKLQKQAKQYKEENQTLTDDFKRIMEKYKELQKKIRHFASVDSKKFHDIWVMNEEEMKQLVKRALDADRIIQGQQLGLPWKEPDLWFMDNVGPLVVQPKMHKTASTLAKEIMADMGGSTHQYREDRPEDTVRSSDPESQVPPTPPVSARTVKQILELMCDESGFLIERKLEQLLSPMEKDERSLIKLDSIFGALRIEVEDDVYKLVDFFQRYSQHRDGSAQDHHPDSPDSMLDSSGDQSPRPTSQTPDLIHPNDLLRALRAFTMEFHRSKDKHYNVGEAGSQGRDSSQDAAYWTAAAKVIPESRIKVWDALESAMEKYYDVLTSRSQLITETSALRQQNTELRMLLHQYLNSKINMELEIPPTKVMQTDISRS